MSFAILHRDALPLGGFAGLLCPPSIGRCPIPPEGGAFMRRSSESRSRLWSILIGGGFLLKSYKTRGKANKIQATEHVGQEGKDKLIHSPGSEMAA